MIMLIMLCYLGCVFLAFKVIKLKVNVVSVAVATVIGVLVLGGILIGWKFSAPISERMTVTRPVIPLLASQNTKELITKIHVKMEQPVKKGELLYEVDSTPFKNAVDQRAAQVEEASRQVQALEAALDTAVSKVAQAQAAQDSAKADLDVTLGIQRDDPAAISKLKVEVERQSFASARAAVDVALASQQTAEYALASARSALLAKKAQLRTAQLDLERAFIRAPADGYIMNWQAAEGTMSTTVISSAQGTFMDMTSTKVIAVFRQNLLANVQPGDSVEMAFKSFPNRIATGKVEAILEYTGEGQFMTQGVVPVVAQVGSKGFIFVRIVLDDEDFARELPLGAAGATAIYTDSGKPFHVITKIVVRMKSWLNNLPG